MNENSFGRHFTPYNVLPDQSKFPDTDSTPTNLPVNPRAHKKSVSSRSLLIAPGGSCYADKKKSEKKLVPKKLPDFCQITFSKSTQNSVLKIYILYIYIHYIARNKNDSCFNVVKWFYIRNIDIFLL